MPGDSRVRALLEQILESHCTPEEACKDCPELLNKVRDGLRRLRQLELEVDLLLPTKESAAAPLEPPDSGLPQIPGYDVEAVLGRGAIGIVYKARHLRLNRHVALKMLLAGAYAPHERARFQREAEAVADLQHPNIVQIYEVGEDHGRPYFSLEYVAGGSLAKKICGTPSPPREAAQLVKSLAHAMEYAHQRGIINCNLKPANVLLTENGEPKVSDFGLVKRLEDDAGQTQSGSILGTPSYMAPEQVSVKPGTIGPAADIYALGALLYEMLTGRPPFRGETATETERQVIHDEPVPLSRLNTKVPRDLETICLTCLNKGPRARYGTAAELASDLSRSLSGEPILARRAGPVERLLKWIRRHSSLTASLVIGVLLVNGLLGDTTLAAHRETWIYHLLRRKAETMLSSKPSRQPEGLRPDGWSPC
jgi:serine/threonine protein kinase